MLHNAANNELQTDTGSDSVMEVASSSVILSQNQNSVSSPVLSSSEALASNKDALPENWEKEFREYCFKGDVVKVLELIIQNDELLTAQFIENLSSELQAFDLSKPIPNLQDIVDIIKGKIPLLTQSLNEEFNHRTYGYLNHYLKNQEIKYEDIEKKVYDKFFKLNKLKEADKRLQDKTYKLYKELVDQSENIMIGEGKRSGDAEEMLKIRAEHAKKIKAIQISDYSARSIVLALSQLLHDIKYMPELRFLLGETKINLKPPLEQSGRHRQAGNAWVEVEQLPNETFMYGIRKRSENGKISTGKFLEELVGNDDYTNKRANKLFTLMTLKTNKMESFKYEELDSNLKIKIDEDGMNNTLPDAKIADDTHKKEVQNKIHYLNGLNFLRSIAEVTRRLYRDENGNFYPYTSEEGKKSDNIPIAIYQSRTALLLQNNHISINDAFGVSEFYGSSSWHQNLNPYELRPTSGEFLHRARYGIATGLDTIENIDITLGKGDGINKLVETKIISSHVNLSIFKSSPNSRIELKNIKAGSKRIREELGNEYGGDSESEGENYSDDEKTGYDSGSKRAKY